MITEEGIFIICQYDEKNDIWILGKDKYGCEIDETTIEKGFASVKYQYINTDIGLTIYGELNSACKYKFNKPCEDFTWFHKMNKYYGFLIKRL